MFYVVPAPGQSGAFVLETDSTQNKAWGQETRLLSWDTHTQLVADKLVFAFLHFRKGCFIFIPTWFVRFWHPKSFKIAPQIDKKIDIDFKLDFGIVFGRPKIDF
jgi:hypothetical protein